MKYAQYIYNIESTHLITERQTGNSRFVLITDITRSWPEALTYCRQHYTDLAILQNLAESNVLDVYSVSGNHVWIGLYRDSWKWSDETNINISTIKWMTGQRNVTGSNRPCGAADPSGLIVDQICSSAFPFICMDGRSHVISDSMLNAHMCVT